MQNFIKTLLILSTLLLPNLSRQLIAQDSFQPAYIVMENGDTTHGYIIDKIDAELAKEIVFKKDINTSDKKVLNVSEIKAFGFDYGRNFERIKATIQSKHSNDSTFVFAKRILEGKIDMLILSHKGLSFPDIYLRNNKSKDVVHLVKVKDKDIKDEEGNTQKAKDYTYMALLKHVKDRQLFLPKKDKVIRFSTKKIKQDINAFNQTFSEEFPVTTYQEKLNFRYTFAAGYQLSNFFDEGSFRFSFYRLKYFHEKSRKLSSLYGITYSQHDGLSTPKSRFLSLIPIGFRYETGPKRLKFYAYAGGGIILFAFYDYQLIETEKTLIDTQYAGLVTLNSGFGTELRMGEFGFFAEITPIFFFNGLMINAGISF